MLAEGAPVEAIFRIVVGILLIAHALVHLLWFAPHKDAVWPFRLDRSGLVPEKARRPVGIALIALVVVAFVLLGLAVWGVPRLASVSMPRSLCSRCGGRIGPAGWVRWPTPREF